MYDKEILIISCITMLISISYILKDIVINQYNYYNKMVDYFNLNWRHYNNNSICLIDTQREPHVTSRMKWTKMNRNERIEYDKKIHIEFNERYHK